MPQEQRPTEKFRTSVGGQALMEGIMMRGPEKICCAVRRPDGTIDLSYSDVTTHWYNKVPLVRGVCNMVENLMNGYKYLMHSADIAMTEEEKEEEKTKSDLIMFKMILAPIYSQFGLVFSVTTTGTLFHGKLCLLSFSKCPKFATKRSLQ